MSMSRALSRIHQFLHGFGVLSSILYKLISLIHGLFGVDANLFQDIQGELMVCRCHEYTIEELIAECHEGYETASDQK